MSKKWTADELEKKVVAIKPMSADDENRIYKKLISARVSILIGYPFFGYLTAHLEFVCDYTITTAATDGNKFYYNPYYIDSLDTPYCAFIIVHELMHCALQHMTRRASREPQRWNYACDYAIHSIIMSYLNHWESKSSQRNAIKMPKNCLYNSKYDNMSSEQIYSILPDNYMSCPQFGAGSSSGKGKNSHTGNYGNNTRNSNSNDDGDGSGSNTGNSNSDDGDNGSSGNNRNQTPLDDHSKWYTREAQKDASIKARTWSGRLLTAAMQARAKDAGALPGNLLRLIDKLTKPQKSWKQILIDYLQQEVNDFSWTLPDNRFTEEEFGDIKLPSFSETEDVARDVGFFIDVSGSMSDEQIAMVYSEIVGAAQQFKLHGYVAVWDTECSELTPFENVTDLIKLKEEASKKFKGGGGTQVESVFNKLKQDRRLHDFTVLIILTDFYLTCPDADIAEGVPVIWTIINDDPENTNPPWGKVVKLDLDNK